MLHKEYLPFYPEIKPNAEHHIKVGDIHQIYVASYGNQKGIPVIALHGGPGSGTAPYFVQFFDPEKYHIILADQRGAGNSLPKGEMKENTTPDLIADIELIRQFYNIDKWVVFGGSWGSSLALLYAEAHPKQVSGMVIRGIFLAREHDHQAHVQDGSPAALMHSKAWARFKMETALFIQQAGLTHLSVATDDIYHVYYEIFSKATDEALKETAAGTIAAWEKFNSFLELSDEELQWSRSADGLNMGLTEAYYFENNCFIRPNQILDDIASLRNIPIHIIQGMYDLVCPPNQADELEDALIKMNGENATNLITRHNCLAGHSHKEPAIRHSLIVALNQLAARF